MHRLILTVVLTVAGAFASANATEYWEGCSGCSSSQQRWAAKRAIPARSVGQFDVYIMDFERETLQKYLVGVVFDRREGGYLSAAAMRPTEVHVAYEFEQAVQAMKADVASLKAGKVIPDSVVGSAYDIVHSSARQQRVVDYINEHLTIWESIAVPTFVPLAALGKVVQLNLAISVSFSDGSTAKFVLTGVEGGPLEMKYTFSVLDGSLKDADGNLIPTTAAEAAPYLGVFSTQPFANEMREFILGWYAQQSPPLISCALSEDRDGVTVTCKRR